jgi:hypothetical protein
MPASGAPCHSPSAASYASNASTSSPAERARLACPSCASSSSRSSWLASSRSRYPDPLVTSRRPGWWLPRPGSRARRSPATYVCTLLLALAGGSPPQTASISVSRLTVVLACTARTARTARCRGGPSGSSAPFRHADTAEALPRGAQSSPCGYTPRPPKAPLGGHATQTGTRARISWKRTRGRAHRPPRITRPVARYAGGRRRWRCASSASASWWSSHFSPSARCTRSASVFGARPSTG